MQEQNLTPVPKATRQPAMGWPEVTTEVLKHPIKSSLFSMEFGVANVVGGIIFHDPIMEYGGAGLTAISATNMALYARDLRYPRARKAPDNKFGLH